MSFENNHAAVSAVSAVLGNNFPENHAAVSAVSAVLPREDNPEPLKPLKPRAGLDEKNASEHAEPLKPLKPRTGNRENFWHMLDGLPLLRDDCQYVAKAIARAHKKDAITFLEHYRRQWEQASQAEPNEIKRDNAGRRQANTWLREMASSPARLSRI